MVESFTPTIADYSALLEQLRADTARQFPKQAGNIFIVNDTKDPQAQIAEAAKALGVPDLSARIAEYMDAVDPERANGEFPRLSGIAVELVVPGRVPENVTVTFGWGYADGLDQKPPATPLAADDYYNYTKVSLHELGHALEGMPGFPPTDQRGRESFAEAFAIAMMVRQGLAPPGYADDAMARYDARKAKGGTQGDLVALRQTQSSLVDPYDPSEEYAALIQRYYPELPPYAPEKFQQFDGLREVFDRLLPIVDAPYQDKGLRHLALIAAQKLGIDTRYHDGDLPRYALGSLREAQDTAIRSLRQQNRTPEEIAEWEKARPDLFPDSAQIDNAEAYRRDFARLEADYDRRAVPLADRVYPAYTPTPEPAPLPLEQLAARLWLKQAETGDRSDYLAARVALANLQSADMQGLMPDQGISPQKEDALLGDRNFTAWASVLVKGGSLDDALAVMRSYQGPAIDLPDGQAVAPAPAPAEPPVKPLGPDL